MGKPYIDFGAVKSAVSMTQVLERYGLLAGMRSTHNGDGYEGSCPIHKGSSPDQFKVSVSKNCWNCFSECQCGGNVLDFVAKMEGVLPHEAAHKLNEWFNLGLDKQPTSPREERRAHGTAPEARAKGGGHENERAVAPSASRPEPEPADEPGHNEPLKFELTNLKSDHAYLTERGLTPEAVAEFGLGFCPKGTMSGRIVIPIHNTEGDLVGYVGRWPGKPPEERPKYKLPTGFKKSAEVFNLDRALTEQQGLPLIVVEGFFDVIKLWQQGFHRVVSIMGSSLSSTQETLLLEASASRPGIILMFDEDDAGRSGREKALLRLARHLFVRVVPLPQEGAQPDHLTESELHALLD